MTQALAGLKVIDLSTGPAAGLATMVLADFGAEVIRIGKPAGSLLDDLAAAPMWLRGKHALFLDLDTETGRAKLDVLLAKADVLVTNWRTSALVRRGLAPRRLRARHPALVVAHVTGFGDRGPYADLPGYEHLVAARVGRMRLFSGIVDREGPVFSALQVGVHACAQSTLSGVLAALHARSQDGRGALVRTSILQGLLSYDQWALLLEQFRPRYPDAFPPVPPPSALPPLPTLHYHPAQAGDGRWLQFGNLLPHLFDNFLRVTDLLDVLIDPEFDPAQMLIRDPERHEAFRLHMLERVQTRSAAEWMADFIADGGIVAAPYQTTQEALDDPDIIANGHVIEREDGGVQIGPLARLTVTPAAPGAAMQTDGERLAALWLAAADGSTDAPMGDRSALPLALFTFNVGVEIG
ncbi:MAG: CoA transferase, partial [Pseudomonadales bacterium]